MEAAGSALIIMVVVVELLQVPFENVYVIVYGPPGALALRLISPVAPLIETVPGAV